MLDRAKAAVFDSLGSYYQTPGRLPPLVVADVFAGGGTLGLEAISRGATAGVFVENDKRAVKILHRNLTNLAVGARATVETVDAWSAGLCEILLQYRCSLVLLDPPYRDAADTSRHGKVMRLIAGLAPLARAMKHSVLVLHHPAKGSFDFSEVKPWHVYAARKYGTTGITFLNAGDKDGTDDQATSRRLLDAATTPQNPSSKATRQGSKSADCTDAIVGWVEPAGGGRNPPEAGL